MSPLWALFREKNARPVKQNFLGSNRPFDKWNFRCLPLHFESRQTGFQDSTLVLREANVNALYCIIEFVTQPLDPHLGCVLERLSDARSNLTLIGLTRVEYT